MWQLGWRINNRRSLVKSAKKLQIKFSLVDYSLFSIKSFLSIFQWIQNTTRRNHTYIQKWKIWWKSIQLLCCCACRRSLHFSLLVWLHYVILGLHYANDRIAIQLFWAFISPFRPLSLLLPYSTGKEFFWSCIRETSSWSNMIWYQKKGINHRTNNTEWVPRVPILLLHYNITFFPMPYLQPCPNKYIMIQS